MIVPVVCVWEIDHGHPYMTNKGASESAARRSKEPIQLARSAADTFLPCSSRVLNTRRVIVESRDRNAHGTPEGSLQGNIAENDRPPVILPRQVVNVLPTVLVGVDQSQPVLSQQIPIPLNAERPVAERHTVHRFARLGAVLIARGEEEGSSRLQHGSDIRNRLPLLGMFQVEEHSPRDAASNM